MTPDRRAYPAMPSTKTSDRPAYPRFSLSGQELSRDEPDIGGALRQPAQVPRVPRVAVSDQVAHGKAFSCQPALLVDPDPVKHRHLDPGLLNPHGMGEPPRLREQVRVVGGHDEAQ